MKRLVHWAFVLLSTATYFYAGALAGLTELPH
jgi:hypothetical protein